jgi:hypothetical protein
VAVLTRYSGFSASFQVTRRQLGRCRSLCREEEQVVVDVEVMEEVEEVMVDEEDEDGVVVVSSHEPRRRHREVPARSLSSRQSPTPTLAAAHASSEGFDCRHVLRRVLWGLVLPPSVLRLAVVIASHR